MSKQRSTSFGYEERTFRLKSRAGQFAWVCDHSGELRSPLFDTEDEARAYMQQQCAGLHVSFVKQTA